MLQYWIMKKALPLLLVATVIFSICVVSECSLYTTETVNRIRSDKRHMQYEEVARRLEALNSGKPDPGPTKEEPLGIGWPCAYYGREVMALEGGFLTEPHFILWGAVVDGFICLIIALAGSALVASMLPADK
jgi:hypothetical protein